MANILRKIVQRYAAAPPPVRRKESKLFRQLTERTLHRMDEDIATWRTALRSAENREYPQRRDLARVYQEISMDAHLTAIIRNRQEAVLGQDYSVLNKDGSTNEYATHLFTGTWFEDFVRAVLDTRLEGYVLIELGDVKENSIDEVYKFPMQYLEPTSGVILTDGYLGGEQIHYRGNESYTPVLVEVGHAELPGLLYKAAPHVLWKRSATKFWAEYCQLFGMPVAIAKTAAMDPDRKQVLSDMLNDMRAAYNVVMDKEEDLEFLESAKTDGSAVYDKLIERCNTELSKLILGQTMTTDSGSSYAQAGIHMQVQNSLIRSDMRFVERIVNTVLIPKLIGLGLPLEEISFGYNRFQELEVKDILALHDKFPIPPAYLARKYGLPIEA